MPGLGADILHLTTEKSQFCCPVETIYAETEYNPNKVPGPRGHILKKHDRHLIGASRMFRFARRTLQIAMKKLRTLVSSFLAASILLSSMAFAQAPDINARIREEGTKNSQVVKLVQTLTDVYGPRLTGSPKLKASGEWAIRQMAEWGMKNGALEPWEFGWPGWENERASGHMLSPVASPLVFEVLAWTPSTNGIAKGKAVQMVIPDRPTHAELDVYFASMREKVRGAIVMYGDPANVPVNLNPPPKRIPDELIKPRFDPNAQRQPGPQGPPQIDREAKPGELNGTQISQAVNKFLMDSGVLVRVNDAGREHGQIRAFSPFRGEYDPAKTLPTVVLRNEDFGRIVRLMKGGRDVELEFDIKNSIYPEGKTAYNVVSEIPGTDKADEVVMLGGHLDSWHAATGATDNATGCAIMMEAARILMALGVKPRRTIRVALWSGEEQGLLGSQAYVAKHFGTAESPKPAWFKFNGYINHDSGTGRIRGLTVFGPPEAADELRRVGVPFADMNLVGAISTASRNTGGTDHTSFNAVGLPGIGTALDPIEYGTHTWHTNLDTFERIIPEDLQQSAIVAAAIVYHLAMADEMLPRFPADKMPPPVRR